MNLVKPPLYGNRSSGRPHGTVHTRAEVVNTMLDLCGYQSTINLANVRLIDPAAGDGAFIVEAVRRLSMSARQYGFNFADAYTKLKAVEIDAQQAVALRENLRNCLWETGWGHVIHDPGSIVNEGDFLLSPSEKFDVVIGNPPYVRYDNIPDAIRYEYSQRFRTFTHRADLYVPFFEKGLRALEPGGKLCFLCANRWMKNSYGQGLRKLVALGYTLSVVVDLEEAKPFEENVNAYPAITLIENRISDEPIQWYETADVAMLAYLDQLSVRRLAKPQGSNWQHCFQDEHVKTNHTLASIEEQGFKIGIGVATGADRVFIGHQLDVEPELLLPIVTSKDLKGNQMLWGGHYFLNPFQANGQLVDVTQYPRLAAYLHRHEETLRNRHVAKKNPANWFRTIDKVDPQLGHQPKLLIPDISANQRLFIDEGKYYPHHNLYYITGPDVLSLKVLGALLMTQTVRQQLAQLTTRMNGGYIRWQSQHLRKLLLPKVAYLHGEHAQELILAFETGNHVLAETTIQRMNLFFNINGNNLSQAA